MKKIKKLKILDCPCYPLKNSDVESLLCEMIESSGYSVAINAEKIMMYNEIDEVKEVIDSSLLPYPDGAGATLAFKLMHNLRVEKIFMPVSALEVANKYKLKVFIFGAKENVHKIAIKRIKTKYPNLKIVGNRHGYTEEKVVMTEIINSKPDISLFAIGSPRQEIFASKISKKMKRGVIIGCGGALDVISGELKRAPKFMIDNNLEWFYRLTQEPWRILRQLKLLKFSLMLLTNLMSGRSK